jgi:hypothetical protein
VVVEREKNMLSRRKASEASVFMHCFLAAGRFKIQSFCFIKKTTLMKFDEMFYTITTLCIPKEL